MSARAGLKKSRKRVNLLSYFKQPEDVFSFQTAYKYRVTSEPSDLVVLSYLRTIKCTLKVCSEICRTNSLVWEETGQYSKAMHGIEQVKQ